MTPDTDRPPEPPDPDDPLGLAAQPPRRDETPAAGLTLPDTDPNDPTPRRRADVDAKQAALGRILADMGCEAVLLFAGPHVAWFTGGLNVRGLTPETERPGVYTNGRSRWLVCANTDTQRLFDEEADRLGFQLKEWQWTGGRAALIGELVAGKKIAADRPFAGLQLVNERLRPELRPLSPLDRERLLALGKVVAHAVEATARNLSRGETEREVAGHVVHRLCRHGAEAAALCVAADGRGRKYRRPGFGTAAVGSACVIQATGFRDGLYATASRTVCFGPPGDLKAEHDAACKISAVYRSLSVPGESLGSAGEAGRALMVDGPYEHEWRHAPPGYGTGWLPAEELRRQGVEDPFSGGQAVVWQARVGAAAVVDTVLVSADGAVPVTPPDGWPYKRVRLGGRAVDVPDLLVRAEG